MGEIYKMEEVMEKPFWLVYCCCAGQGVSMPNNAPGNCCAAQTKFLCCAQAQVCEDAIVDGIWCSQLGTFLCIWSECSLPPADGNPFLALCNQKYNKDHSKAKNKAPEKPKPRSQEINM